MKLILIILFVMTFTSCASIFNSRYCKTDLRLNIPATAIIDSDTIELEANSKNNITLQRGKTTKKLILISDITTDTIELNPQWSFAYNLNCLSFGLGLLADWKTQKKWTYSPSITIHYNDDNEKNGTRISFNYNRYAVKNALNLRLSLPWANLFNSASVTDNQRKSSAGFMGFSAGLDYFYNGNIYLNISGTGITNCIIPFPAAIDYAGIHTHMYSAQGSISNNHMLNKKRFSIGYGISYGYDKWNTVNHGGWSEDAHPAEVAQESVYRNSNSLGLILPFYYFTKRSLYMGIVYRPMFLQFAGKTYLKYQHTISFDIGWRIRLKK